MQLIALAVMLLAYELHIAPQSYNPMQLTYHFRCLTNALPDPADFRLSIVPAVPTEMQYYLGNFGQDITADVSQAMRYTLNTTDHTLGSYNNSATHVYGFPSANSKSASAATFNMLKYAPCPDHGSRRFLSPACFHWSKQCQKF